MECTCGRIRPGEPFNRMKDCPKCWLRSRQGLIVANRNTIEPGANRVYFEFPHGLGDCVQFTSVLRHLKKHRPDWVIDIGCVDEGRAMIFKGLVNAVYTLNRIPGTEYNEKRRIRFHESPKKSKVWQCLQNEFRIDPEIELLPYQLNFDTLPKSNEIVLHYKGSTSKHKKDLEDKEISIVIQWILSKGLTPVVLDWSSKTPARFHRAPKTEDIAPMIDASLAWVGIDSGPGHVGGATDSPGLVVWTLHHPVRFYDPCPNVEHLIPSMLLNKELLDPHFKYREYSERKLVASKIIEFLAEKIGCDSQHMNPQVLTSKAYDEQYYREHVKTGLDYAIHGDWQREYGEWILKFLTLVVPVEQSQRESEKLVPT